MLAGVLQPCASSAQQAPTTGFDQRQTEQRFDAAQTRQQRSRQPAIRGPRFTQQAPLDSRPAFVLHRVSIDGALTLSAKDLEQTYAPYLGKPVSQADLATIANSIGEIYRSAGYHLSRAVIPAQDVARGTIRIRVIEGKITDLEIKTSDADRFGIRATLSPIVGENPSRLSTVERRLLLVNDIPGVRVVDTTLDEIGVMTGHFKLSVVAKTWRAYANIGLDNLGSSSVGPWQSYLTTGVNSILTPGDSLAFNFSTVPNDPHELAFSRLTYEAPIGVDGVRVGMTASHSEVRPGDFRRNFNDTTFTDSFELRGTFVPIQSQASTLSFTLAAGATNASEKDSFGPFYNDRIRTIALSSDYRVLDGFGGTNYFYASVRQGLDVFGASQKGDAFLSHDGASGEFSFLSASYVRYQKISDSWSVKFSTAGQFASAPLLTSQQFYLGGASFGRGYGSAEISGDNALAESVELRFDQRLDRKYFQGFQLYAFADNGAAWNFGYQYRDGLSLTSAGAGVRFFFNEDLTAGLAVAVPLTYRAPDNEKRSPRILFSISNAFRLCGDRIGGACL